MNKSITQQLHELFNQKKRYTMCKEESKRTISPTKKELPQNGIYIIFEKGEKFENFDRIVRVGTHRGDGNLYTRLRGHFIGKNKNSSIFRKNIGRAILNQYKSLYLNIWNLNTGDTKIKQENKHLIDSNFEKQLEGIITTYIQENMSFVVFEVENEKDRLFWEKKIIATLAQSGIKPSQNWLGNHHPDSEIHNSGLWNKQGLNAQPLTQTEFDDLKNLVLR